MFDPRTWSRRMLVLMALLAASALPMALSACGEEEVQCPDGPILVDGVYTNAEG